MDNHPIPQDVTGFQFKLVGDMTLKQFAYLAVGAVMGWVFYQLSINFLIKIPLMFAFPGLGVGLAFIPIAGRPMDTMFINFFKAVVIPNQYIYDKVGGQILAFTPSIKKINNSRQTAAQNATALEKYLKSLPQQSNNPLDQKENTFFQSLAFAPSQPHVVPQPTQMYTIPPAPPQVQPQEETQPPTPVMPPEPPVATSAPAMPAEPPVVTYQLPTQAQLPTIEQQEQFLEQESQILQQQIATARQTEAMQTQAPQAQAAHNQVSQFEQQLNEVLSQKAALEQQLQTLTQQLQTQQQQAAPVSVQSQPVNVNTPSATPTPVAEQPIVSSVPKEMGAKVGLPITPDAENVLSGIVKDSRGNVLPHILIEVRNREGTPIRAFKTNTLGQFASATALLNGEYTIELEDPSGTHKFQSIPLSVTGQIILPFEIISTDAREELRRDLFGA